MAKVVGGRPPGRPKAVVPLTPDLEKAYEETIPEVVLAPDDTDTVLLVDDVNELSPRDRSIVLEDIEWKPTHTIGDYIVQQRTFATGLPYYVEEDGKRRRPTDASPLKRYIPPPAEAIDLYIDRTVAALCFNILGSEDSSDMQESGWHIAKRIDDSHIQLSLRVDNEHKLFLVHIPDEIKVVAVPL